MPKKPLHVAIVGFSREGHSLLKYVKTAPQFRGAVITILDKDPKVKVPRGVKLMAGPDYLNHLNNFSVILRSPGIPYMRPEIQRAIKNGKQVLSATALFLDELYARKKRPIVVGVTGTKGKGTTATLIYQCLKAARVNAVLAGNIGTSMLDVLNQAKKAKVVVLELSSFQLQDLHRSPDIAVVLPVTPDHLDVHQSLVEYYTAKTQITAHQDRDDSVFYLPENIPSAEIVRHSLGKKTLVVPETFSLFRQTQMTMPGKHNYANAVMAATIARVLGVRDEVIVKTITRFKGLPYHLELTRVITLPGGGQVAFYNDSASTIPESGAAAIRAFTDPTVLIAGGKSKVNDYGVLRNALMRSAVFAAVLFGENREKILAQLTGLSQQFEVKSGTLLGVVQQAYSIAKKQARQQGGRVNVVFSPASASFDMFKNWYDRSEQFAAIVKKLKV